jgi:hypothetical protein
MYEILILIAIALIIFNKSNIEGFNTGKCDINEEKFRKLEEQIKSSSERSVVVNNNCDENKRRKEPPSPPPQDNSSILINRMLEQKMGEVKKKEEEYDTKLSEIDSKLKQMEDEKLKKEQEEEKEDDDDDDDDDDDLEDYGNKFYEIIERVADPNKSNNLINNIIFVLGGIFAIIALYYFIVLVYDMLKRKPGDDIELINLSYDGAKKAVMMNKLKKKYKIKDVDIFS